MNRLTMTFIVLTATGGCMSVDRDPIDDYPYPSSRRPTAQSSAFPPPGSTQWSRADGRPVQAAYADWESGTSNSRSSATSSSWSSTSQNTTAAAPKKTTTNSSSTTVTAAKPASPPRSRASKTDKTEDELVKATYTEAKGSGSDSKKTVSAKASSSAVSQAAEPKSPPVNLGVLRLLNSKRITFHYEVKDPAAMGVAGLEMWGTTDMRSWKKYNIVTRAPSSLVVEVKEEGLYGFSMLARGKNEPAKDPPVPGEAPQVWVCVDLTKPDVQLLGAELNIMAKTPGLVIRWSARDRNFGPRPITLLYAERMEGPWTPFAANVENTGRYEWNMPPCVPSSVFVRAQAVDLMGNTAMAQTTTLHIPGRSAPASAYNEPKLADPPQLGKTLPPPPPAATSATSESHLRPVSLTTAPNPAVSILSVGNE